MNHSGIGRTNTLYLSIGEIIISDRPAVVHTVLGSCVAVCIYSVRGDIGGINHFGLPTNPDASAYDDDDYRYGESAISTLIEAILSTPGVERKNLRAKILGGAQQMGEKNSPQADIGPQNVAIARRLLTRYKITVTGEDTGGTQGRKMFFYTDSGKVKVALVGEPPAPEKKPPIWGSPPPDKPPVATVIPKTATAQRSRVLIVDDSKTVQEMLKRVIAGDTSLEVAGVASSAAEAQRILATTKVDVMTLDIHMPGMDGVTFLEKLMKERPLPVIMVTALSMESGSDVLRALELGAVDYIQKPQMAEITALAPMICEKIRGAALARIRKAIKNSGVATPPAQKTPQRETRTPFVAIGSSTGGTEALKEILLRLPADIPPIVIVQHIPPVFSRSFADHLNMLCPFEVKEAEDGDRVLAGRVLVAPGGLQMALKANGYGYRIELSDSPPVNRHKPSVDVLFDSAARLARGNAIGVILTGMGNDGAAGLLAMKRSGCRTIAQDEASCVVFGMPKEAIRLGGAEEICDLGAIPHRIEVLSRAKRTA